MRYAAGVEYNGSHYHGWQEQTDSRLLTLSRCITQAISKVANHPIKLICAGRTDAHVHATGQVIHFETTAHRSEHNWLQGVNSYLPHDMALTWIKPVSDNFHARFSALSRRYVYIIYNCSARPAILNGQVSWIYYPLDEKRMQIAGNFLLGEHDFSSYRAKECQAKTPIRRIYHLNIERRNQYILIDIKANAFLHHMVRNIVGVLQTIAAGQKEPVWAREVLETRNRSAAGVTATPHGLYLVQVEYPDEFGIGKELRMPLLISPFTKGVVA